MPQFVPQLKATDVLPCARVDDFPVPNSHSFMSQCVQCGARIWVACSSPIETQTHVRPLQYGVNSADQEIGRLIDRGIASKIRWQFPNEENENARSGDGQCPLF